MRSAPALAALLLALAAASARGGDAPVLRTRVVSDVQAVRAGEPFTLGVLVSIPAGFHIYWKGTGGTGIPTTLELSLPRGFRAGEVHNPTPRRFVDPTLTTVGYEGEVLLSARVTPPADLAGVSSVTIGVTVAWLCCDKERCVPGDAELAFAATVAARTTPDAAGAALLVAWKKKTPVELAASPGFSLGETKALPAGAKKGRLQARLALPEEATAAELFPAAPSALEVGALSARPDGRAVALALDVAILDGETLAAETLEVVLAYDTKGGERRGVRLLLPIRH